MAGDRPQDNLHIKFLALSMDFSSFKSWLPVFTASCARGC